MSAPAGFQLTQPVKLWNRPLNASFGGLFQNLGKAIGAFSSTGDWGSASRHLVDALGDIGLVQKPEELAWRLLFVALCRAVDRLVEEAAPLGMLEEKPEAEQAHWAARVEAALADTEVTLDAQFFEQPRRLALLAAFRDPFRAWLEAYGLEAPRARALAGRLESYFVLELHREWGQQRGHYERIREQLETPFTRADARERSWLQYAAWLEQQIEAPLFDESFSLNQVYVPLRATFRRKRQATRSSSEGQPRLTLDSYQPGERDDREKEERVAVELAEHLFIWARDGKREDGLRVIAGGPGSGKSSFCRKFAADHAAALRGAGITTLLIPLHHFEPLDDLPQAVGDYLASSGQLDHNPLAADASAPLLLIFDGLDELSQQGHIGAEVTRRFVQNLEAQLSRRNVAEPRLRILLTGRELVIQANEALFLRDGCLLTLLPYWLSERERKGIVDPGALLAADQRDAWWQRYGAATGKPLKALPGELRSANLTEITAQPLLNYLVALAWGQEGASRLQFDRATSLNAIYQNLVEAVYQRGWAEGRRRAFVEDLTLEQFLLVLEEIALSAWHGDGRKTSVVAIERHCAHSGLTTLLEPFKRGSERGVTRLLTAFYFRQSALAGAATEQTFEFTHKSFGEYLTARRLFRLMEQVVEERERRDTTLVKGWDAGHALVEWARVTGPTRMDHYLHQFLKQEVAHRLSDPAEARRWQGLFAELLRHAVLHGSAMEALGHLSFQAMREQCVHAEEALLAAHAALAQITREVVPLDWPDDRRTAFGDWLYRVQGQRDSVDNVVALQALGFLDLQRAVLDGHDLLFANLRDANLQDANLQGARLEGARLEGANLRYANLQGANLQGAELRRDALTPTQKSQIRGTPQ